MSDGKFDWLLGKFNDAAAEMVEGQLIRTISWPFSVELMDAVYDFQTQAIKHLQDYLELEMIEVDKIVIFSAFATDLKRVGTKSSTETVLHIVENGGKKAALLFTGTTIKGS